MVVGLGFSVISKSILFSLEVFMCGFWLNIIRFSVLVKVKIVVLLELKI